MLLSAVLAAFLCAAVFFGILTGTVSQVSLAVTEGAWEAVQLALRLCGTLCLWSGVMEVMDRSGLTRAVAHLLSPVISLLFGRDGEDSDARAAVSQNMAANLLGLGSAATPSGLRAAKRLQTLAEQRGEKPHAALLLMVLNTASLQLLPTTVAAVRAGVGCARPYDILPAVWLASLGSVTVGVCMAKLLRRRDP